MSTGPAHPQDPQSVARGLTLLELGRAAEAESHFRDALAQDPTSGDVLAHLARALHAQDRHEESLAAARNALALDPGHLGALLTLSSALAGLSQWDAALDTVDRALQLAPDLPGLHRQRGALLLMRKRPQEALACLEHALRLDPEDSLSWSTLARVLHALRRRDDADAALARALALDPTSTDAHSVRSQFDLARGGGRQAVASTRVLMRLDPNDEASRELHALARKSRNPLFGLLLRFGDLLDALPSGARWAFVLAPFLLSRLLRPFMDALWAQLLLGILLALVVLSWTLEPVMNALLMTSRHGRGLLPAITRRATTAFLAYMAAVVCIGIVGVATDEGLLLFTAFGLGLWGISVGQVHLIDMARRRLAIGLHACGAVLAAGTVVTALLGTAGPMALALVLTGMAMTWFTALA